MLKHPVPEEHLKHIGDITVSFALLELIIKSLVGSLVGQHQRIGQIITAELSFGNSRALAKSLYLEHYGKDADFSTLDKLMKMAVNVEQKRNQITHSAWAAGDKPDRITRIKYTAKEKVGYKFLAENVDTKELADFASEIKQLADDIQRFDIHLMKKGK